MWICILYIQPKCCSRRTMDLVELIPKNKSILSINKDAGHVLTSTRVRNHHVCDCTWGDKWKVRLFVSHESAQQHCPLVVDCHIYWETGGLACVQMCRLEPYEPHQFLDKCQRLNQQVDQQNIHLLVGFTVLCFRWGLSLPPFCITSCATAAVWAAWTGDPSSSSSLWKPGSKSTIHNS